MGIRFICPLHTDSSFWGWEKRGKEGGGGGVTRKK